MDTIFALASAQGKAGVSVIRLSGPKAISTASVISGGDLPRPGRVLRVLSDCSGARIDEALLLTFTGPNSFTGEDTVEFQVHDRALVVLVFSDGHVENRLFTPPPGQTPSSMREAANFLNALIEGRTLGDVRGAIQEEIKARQQQIDVLAREMIESGLAAWEDDGSDSARLIVRGRSNLLSDGGAAEELDRIRNLFDDLERKRDIEEFLQLTEDGEGVRIFIGSENKLFSLSGSSLVVSPYMNADRKIIGAVGVIGPTRLNYGRIVPIVDYTAQLVGKLLSDRS